MLKQKILPKLEKELTEEQELESCDLEEFIETVCSEIELENQTEQSKRLRKWAKNRNFYRGNQRGFWDKNQKNWVNIDLDVLSPMEQSILTVNNMFRPQVKTLCKEFSRSQSRVRASPISDSQRSILTARFSDALIRFYQSEAFPESLRQLEAKYLLLCGNSFRYTYYDSKKTGVKVQVPKMGMQMLPAYESSICSECGEEGEGETCDKCGGIMEHTSVEGMETQGIQGYEQVNSGEIHVEVVDPAEIKVWSGAQNLEESPYLRRKRLVRTEYIREIFPHYKPRKTGKLSDTGSQLSQFYDTSNEKSTEQNSKLHEYDQLWIEPTYYQRKKLKKPIKLMNGQEIPEETPFMDIFKDGMYVCRVDGDNLGFANEHKMKCWQHFPYDTSVDGFWADGLEDAVQNQQIINEYNSLGIENVLYNASPKLVINPKLINPATVTGRPKDMLLLNENARSEVKPEDSFSQISGMQLTGEVAMGVENAKRDMREQTGALLGFNGQGDPYIDTATGMSIARDSALALVATALALRSEKELGWCWQILDYVQEYWYDQKYKFLLGKYNESEANSFRDSKLREEIQLSVEAGSWMPQTNYEKVQNLGAFLTAFGVPMGFLNPQIPQPVRDYACQLYQIPFEFNELSPDIRIAQKRLTKAKEAFGSLFMIILQSTSPREIDVLSQALVVTLANIMETEPDIDEHQVFIMEYIKWLKTDEGQNAEPLMREAVKTAIADHKRFLQMQQDEQLKAMQQVSQATGNQPQNEEPTFQPEQADNPQSPFAPEKVGDVKDFSRNPNK